MLYSLSGVRTALVCPSSPSARRSPSSRYARTNEYRVPFMRAINFLVDLTHAERDPGSSSEGPGPPPPRRDSHPVVSQDVRGPLAVPAAAGEDHARASRLPRVLGTEALPGTQGCDDNAPGNFLSSDTQVLGLIIAQAAWRGRQARKLANQIRLALLLQKSAKAALAARNFAAQRRAAIVLQSLWRGHMARVYTICLRAAIKIQVRYRKMRLLMMLLV